MAEPETAAFFDFLNDNGLLIPGLKSAKHPEGKDYLIPSPDADTGARLTALAEVAFKSNQGIEVHERDLARLQMDDEEEREFMAQVLGSALPILKADGVPWVALQRLTNYAFTHFAVGAEAARDGAAKGLFSGKAPALNRAQRRAQGKTATTGAAPKAPRASTASRARPK